MQLIDARLCGSYETDCQYYVPIFQHFIRLLTAQADFLKYLACILILDLSGILTCAVAV